MTIENLLEGIEYKCDLLPQAQIRSITTDSRKVAEGWVFVCVAGEAVDGHDFAQAAAKKGCVAIVAERQTGADAPHIIVENSRAAYSHMCANYFGNPARRIKLIGVTGTNGKTTTTFLIKEILEYNHHKTGLIGTIQNMAGDEVLPAQYTTPEPFELQQLFKKIADAGCEYAVMEVSSHALAQERVTGCRFYASIFTNLTQDHLNYHKTMENYLAAKKRLFDMSDIGIINLDDSYSSAFITAAPCRTVTYSTKLMSADYTACNIKLRQDGIDYELVGMGVIGRVSTVIPGEFSVYNTLAAAACSVTLGIPFAGVIDALGAVKGVKGRIEVVPTGRDFTIIIDYAHTPDALEKILKAIKGFSKGRIVALFGCGGDRDKTKRPIMGNVVAQNSDFAIVTSDNPRTENAAKIIEDILVGMNGTKTPFIVIENRHEAIEYAIKNAKHNDIILLAGKGHEDYQIIGHEKHRFDEREVVAEILILIPN